MQFFLFGQVGTKKLALLTSNEIFLGKMGYRKIKNTKITWSFALNRTPLPKDSSGEMELKAEQTAREIEEVSSSN